MQDRKSEFSQSNHYVTNVQRPRSRCNQPCMFQILAWPTSEDNVPKQCPHCANNNNTKSQCGVRQPHIINYCPEHENEQDKFNGHHKYTNQGCIEDQKSIQCEILHNRNQNGLNIYKKTLKPHEVHDQLYMYEKIHLRKSLDDQILSKKVKTQENQIQLHRLNRNDENDRKIIKQREAKIKQFGQLTRDLPNSAFSTYYGKPAFQAYGRCNSQHQKTHSVMPHAGPNHPNIKQTYSSALIHGKKLNTNNYLPRKPIQSICRKSSAIQLSQQPQNIVNLPIQKPDLINHIRFSESEPKPQKKLKLSDTTNTNPTKKKKTMAKSKTNKSTIFMKDKKQTKKGFKSTISFNDGLKFMNTRENLLELLEAKKTRDSRLAYKVTECYPQGAVLDGQQSQIESQYREYPPAGKKYEKGLSAKQIIHERNILKL